MRFQFRKIIVVVVLAVTFVVSPQVQSQGSQSFVKKVVVVPVMFVFKTDSGMTAPEYDLFREYRENLYKAEDSLISGVLYKSRIEAQIDDGKLDGKKLCLEKTCAEALNSFYEKAEKDGRDFFIDFCQTNSCNFFLMNGLKARDVRIAMRERKPIRFTADIYSVSDKSLTHVEIHIDHHNYKSAGYANVERIVMSHLQELVIKMKNKDML